MELKSEGAGPHGGDATGERGGAGGVGGRGAAVHGLRGRRSNRAHAPEVRERALALAAEPVYMGSLRSAEHESYLLFPLGTGANG